MSVERECQQAADLGPRLVEALVVVRGTQFTREAVGSRRKCLVICPPSLVSV
jgi:hypothetical protein